MLRLRRRARWSRRPFPCDCTSHAQQAPCLSWRQRAARFVFRGYTLRRRGWRRGYPPMIATRGFVQQAAIEFNRLQPAELAAYLREIPTGNLVVLRDAARALAPTGALLPQDVALIVGAVTTEIERRWAAA